MNILLCFSSFYLISSLIVFISLKLPDFLFLTNVYYLVGNDKKNDG